LPSWSPCATEYHLPRGTGWGSHNVIVTGGRRRAWCSVVCHGERGRGDSGDDFGEDEVARVGDSSDDFGTTAIALRRGGDGSGTAVSPA
jgi:hypothetical protein